MAGQAGQQTERELAGQAGQQTERELAGQAGQQTERELAGQAGQQTERELAGQAGQQTERELAGEAGRAPARAREAPVEPRIGERVLAAKPVEGGLHAVKVAASGAIYRCSPRCDLIMDLLYGYEHVFTANPGYMSRLKQIEEYVALVQKARKASLVEAERLADQVADHAAALLDDVERAAVGRRELLERGVLAAEEVPTAEPMADLWTHFMNDVEKAEITQRAIKFAEGRTVPQALARETIWPGRSARSSPSITPTCATRSARPSRRPRARACSSSTRRSAAGSSSCPGRLRGSDRFIRLGTDRIAGAAKIAPQDIPMVWRDGSRNHPRRG